MKLQSESKFSARPGKFFLAVAASAVAILAFAGPASAAPTNTVDPSFTGSVYNTNSILTAVNGTWSGTGTISYTYEWQVSSNNFGPGITTVGTGSTYTIPVNTSYCDDYIRVAVTATDSTGSTTVASSASQINCPSSSNPSLDNNPGSYDGAELIGIRRVGETLTLNWGGSSGDWTYPGGGSNALVIQWQRNCGSSWSNFDPGAGDDLTYVLTTADIDCDIHVVLTATTTYSSTYVYSTTATTNLRGVIQRKYGNIYYVRAEVAPDSSDSNVGAAPDGHNDCLGDSSDVNAPNPAGGTSNSGFEACAQPWQAASEEDSDTNPNNDTKMDIGDGTFDGLAVNNDDSNGYERMLIQGSGTDNTALEGDCEGGDVVDIATDSDTDEPRSVNVTVKDLTIDGGGGCDGIRFDNASGEVQNVDFVDLDLVGVDAYADRPSPQWCQYPERVRVDQSSFEDGTFDDEAVSFGQDWPGDPGGYDTGCSFLKGSISDSSFDGDFENGIGVFSLGPVSSSVNDSEFTDIEAGVFNLYFTKEAKVTDSTFSCTGQGVASYFQDAPDYQPPNYYLEGPYGVSGQKGNLEVSGNQFGCDDGIPFPSLAVNIQGGVADVTGNTITDQFLGAAIGPVVQGFGTFAASLPGGAVTPQSVPELDSPVAATLRGNTILSNYSGVISTNNGYVDDTDLKMVGNRIADNYFGLTNYYDNEFDAFDEGAWPPSSNLQTSPVEAKNNWWGCNDGPTVNPDASDIEELLESEDPDSLYCSDGAPLAGDIILDGGLSDPGAGPPGVDGTDPAETNVDADPYLVMGCGASPRTIQRADYGGLGGTSLVTASLARNSQGVQQNVSFPPSGVTFGVEDNPLGTDYANDEVETDQATYQAQASLKAGAKLGTVTPTASLDYQQQGCDSVVIRNGPDRPLFPEVKKAGNSRNNTARVPSSRKTALIKVTCPARNIGDCEILSVTATSRAPGTGSLETEMIIPTPIIQAGSSVELKGLIPRSVYRRLVRADNGSEARIRVRVEGSAGVTDKTLIRDLRRS